jgi:hypothetical protein
MMPRISGNAVQKPNGKWTFELFVGFLGMEECDHYKFKMEYDTEKEALKELNKAAQLICEKFESLIDGKPSGEYIDLKTNSTRRWDKSDEN